MKELAETASKAQAVWVDARAKSDFKLFLPWLKKVIRLKKKEAEFVGYKHSPYDALLDYHEPSMTVQKTTDVLNELKNFLIPFAAKIKNSKIKIKTETIKGRFPIEKQVAFNKKIAEKNRF